MAESKIEWTDYTFNPWWGCERVSPGCAHCYADTLAIRYGHRIWGPRHGFRFFGDGHWAEPIKWNVKAEREGVRRRVFCASMADVFEERPELNPHRSRLLWLIEATPHLDWQLLTKRPEYARAWFSAYLGSSPMPPNLWLGVSIENARYTWRADVLRQIPAATRFISAEPLLGSLYPTKIGDTDAPKDRDRAPVSSAAELLPVDDRDAGRVGLVRDRTGEGGRAHVCHDGVRLARPLARRAPLDLTGIDWVIIGGESGPGARPFHLEHAREIVRECVNHSVAVFVKQLGARPVQQGLDPIGDGGRDWPLKLRDRKGGDWAAWPGDLRIREFPSRSDAEVAA